MDFENKLVLMHHVFEAAAGEANVCRIKGRRAVRSRELGMLL